MLGKVLHDLRDVSAGPTTLGRRDMLELVKNCMEWDNLYAMTGNERKFKWFLYNGMHKDVLP